MRLSPNDTYKFNMQTVVAHAYLIAGRFGESVSWAEMAIRERSTHLSAWRVLAAGCALSGQREQAQKAMMRIRDLDPALRLSNLNERIPFRRQEDSGLLAEGCARQDCRNDPGSLPRSSASQCRPAPSHAIPDLNKTACAWKQPPLEGRLDRR